MRLSPFKIFGERAEVRGCTGVTSPASDVRSQRSVSRGSLGESGCVAWLFDQRGLIAVDSEGRDSDELGLTAIDAGAEDVRVDEGGVEVLTRPSELDAVRGALESQGITVDKIHVQQTPKQSSAQQQGGRQQQQSSTDDNAARQDRQRKEMLQRMWSRLAYGSDPLDMVA